MNEKTNTTLKVGELFRLIGRTTTFRVVRTYKAAGYIPAVEGHSLDGKTRTFPRVVDTRPAIPHPPVRRYEYWAQEHFAGQAGTDNAIWRDVCGLGNRTKDESIEYFEQVWGDERGTYRLVERRIDETILIS
jgi:hypothetical protein